jgi:acyl-CoA dehydrogenase
MRPTELHKMTLARQVLRDYEPVTSPFPSGHLPSRRAAAQARLAQRLEREVAEF